MVATSFWSAECLEVAKSDSLNQAWTSLVLDAQFSTPGLQRPVIRMHQILRSRKKLFHRTGRGRLWRLKQNLASKGCCDQLLPAPNVRKLQKVVSFDHTWTALAPDAQFSVPALQRPVIRTHEILGSRKKLIHPTRLGRRWRLTQKIASHGCRNQFLVCANCLSKKLLH